MNFIEYLVQYYRILKDILFLQSVIQKMHILTSYATFSDNLNNKMDNQNFELILFKTGEKFLQYIIDFNEPLVRLKKTDEYAFKGVIQNVAKLR